MRRFVLAASTAAVLGGGTAFFAPASAADSWAGQYAGHHGSYRWKATITNKSAGIYALHVSVDSRMPECSGDTTETARLAADKLVTDSKDCALTVARLGPKRIQIKENQCSEAHGMACPFDSELSRR